MGSTVKLRKRKRIVSTMSETSISLKSMFIIEIKPNKTSKFRPYSHLGAGWCFETEGERDEVYKKALNDLALNEVVVN